MLFLEMLVERYCIQLWLRLYCVVIIAATVGSLAIAAFQGQTLLYKPFLRFTDLTPYLEKAKHPIGNAEMIVASPPQLNYPAPGIFVYSAFANLPGDSLSWFIGTIVLAAIASVWLLERRLASAGIDRWTRRTLAAATLLTSYPLWIELDRANIEGVLWIFVLLGMFLFVRRHFVLSGVCIALASTIKPFPLIIFAIFLAHALYKEVLVSAFVWVAVTVSAFVLTSGTLTAASRHYTTGTAVYQGAIAVGYKGFEINYDHSLFSAVKQFVRLIKRFPPSDVLDHSLALVYRPYLVLAACGGLLCLYILRRRPLANQLLGVFVLMVLLPPSNYDYTLLSLYVPFGFFLVFLVDDVARDSSLLDSRTIAVLLFCFAVIFTCQTFLYFHQTGFGGQVKTLALLGALGVALAVPMRTAVWDEAALKEHRAGFDPVAVRAL